MTAATLDALISEAMTATQRRKEIGRPRSLAPTDAQRIAMVVCASREAQEQAAWLVAARSSIGLAITEGKYDARDLAEKEQMLAETGHKQPAEYLASLCGVSIQ